MSEVEVLENRVTRLESQLTNDRAALQSQITEGFNRLEGLVRTEITDLKNEQLGDLRDANRRLSDDQRRLWEAVRTLEGRENQRTGGGKALGSIGHVLSAGIGGVIALVGNWLSSGHTPHP